MVKLILASKSPRRQALLQDMGFSFEVRVRDVEESFPPTLNPSEAVEHIAQKKAEAFQDLSDQHLILTADTIVVIEGEILGKPRDEQDAIHMISKLSGRTHEVLTACCIYYQKNFHKILDVTQVTFRELLPGEITHYVHTYRPLDKAGSYGIQEWIGTIGITSIQGSYQNVVGLPTAKVYDALVKLGITPLNHGK